MPVMWSNEKHSIGIEAIDEQHKGLFAIINELFELSGQPLGADRQRHLIGVFKRLFMYAKFHFSTEESLFKTWQYSARLEHGIKHKEFTDKIIAWTEESKAKPNMDLAQILDYLVSWIVFHIQEEDTKYAWEFHKQGIVIDLNAIQKGKVPGTEMLDLWNQRQLATGISEMDRQHRELVMILQQTNDLAKASLARQRVLLPEIIAKLFYYSQYHFSWEEELMSRNQWRGLHTHRTLHGMFIDAIRQFSQEYNGRKLEGLAEHIVLWLKDWTIQHILVEDTAFKHWLQKSGKSA